MLKKQTHRKSAVMLILRNIAVYYIRRYQNRFSRFDCQNIILCFQQQSSVNHILDFIGSMKMIIGIIITAAALYIQHCDIKITKTYNAAFRLDNLHRLNDHYIIISDTYLYIMSISIIYMFFIVLYNYNIKTETSQGFTQIYFRM